MQSITLCPVPIRNVHVYTACVCVHGISLDPGPWIIGSIGYQAVFLPSWRPGIEASRACAGNDIHSHCVVVLNQIRSMEQLTHGSRQSVLCVEVGGSSPQPVHCAHSTGRWSYRISSCGEAIFRPILN